MEYVAAPGEGLSIINYTKKGDGEGFSGVLIFLDRQAGLREVLAGYNTAIFVIESGVTMTLSALPGWLSSLHHDGCDLYVSNPNPRLGETVRLRLRAERGAPIQRVLLRIFPDGEQMLTPMTWVEGGPAAQWWEGSLTVTQPRVNYRFLVQAVDGVWWLTAAGAVAYEPLDATDFALLADYSAPEWLAGAVFYQIFPERFANGDPSNDPRPEEYEYRGARPRTFEWGQPPAEGQPFSLVFYGGDLAGIRERLDYLQALGVTALYLTPVFTAYSNHKYDVADYDHVDAHFGGDEALAELRAGLDARGMRYILDIVPNHCGFWHPWFQRAQADAASAEAEFFTFSRHPQEYTSWLGVWSLPKLNYRSTELRRRMYGAEDAVFRHWLRPPFRADGWRLDVANMLGRQGTSQLGDEVAREIRQAVKATSPQAYLMGENFFDASSQLQGDQWDGVMNYMGFSTPLWNWLRGYWAGAWGLKDAVGSPVPYPTAALAESWQLRLGSIPWAVVLQQYNLLDSHDTPRIRSQLKGNDALHRLAVTLLMTFPGVPGLYYGDEIGMQDAPGLGSRGCMEWDEGRWERDLLAFHRELIALRRHSGILQRGGFQILAVEQDFLVYQRESREGRILVAAQRSTQARPAGGVAVRRGGMADGMRFVEHFSGAEAVVRDGWLPLPALPQGATLWECV